MAQNTSRGWHFANYGLLGWLETAIKSVGIALGIAAFAAASSDLPLIIGGNPRLGAVILAVLMILLCLAAIAARLQLKDIFAMIYAVANLIGHLALIVALLRAPTQTTLPILFGLAYLAGDAVKLYWLRVSGYTEGGMDAAGMRRLVYSVLGMYAAFVIALVV
ncbi:MAG: hypothetical protein IPK52_19430 [Chloroflexi bacterium]|nr:hypothetical protein [Chloroflexota bacterium]